MAKKVRFVTEKDLQFWTEQDLNVLLCGNHGTGKSTMVINTWNKLGLKWAYFSGATLDPWVDFVGIPQKVVDPETNQAHIQIIPPAWLLEDVEAIFIDELNRSHKKIKNALMEAIQFKTINGRKLGKLRMVWAAINPDDEEMTYDVEKMDPAQQDRFHLYVELPNEPCQNYFRDKYGKMGENAVEWWGTQAENVKKEISPRRLDYALDAYIKNVDLAYVLPEGSNIKNLIERISSTSFLTEMQAIFTTKNKDKMREFLADEEKFNSVYKRIVENRNLYTFCLELMPEEKISQLIADNDTIQAFALQNATSMPIVCSVLQEIYKANANNELCLKIKRYVDSIYPDEINDIIKKQKINKTAVSHKGVSDSSNYEAVLKVLSNSSMDTTTDRIKAYEKVVSEIPLKISETDSLETLKLLEDILNRSHKSVVEKNMGNLIGIVNLVMGNLQAYKFKNFREEYPKLAKFLVFREDFIYVK